MDQTKLVTDGTPGLMECYGPKPITRILEPDEYQEALRQKLQAAVAGFCATGHFSHLDELLLLVYAFVVAEGQESQADLEQRTRAALECGGGYYQRCSIVWDAEASA
jgi:predicted house-cleaning noncanonical NTP pyrophosphatase (MazG superfamily)